MRDLLKAGLFTAFANKKGIILLRDNARSHIAEIMLRKTNKLKMNTLLNVFTKSSSRSMVCHKVNF